MAECLEGLPCAACLPYCMDRNGQVIHLPELLFFYFLNFMDDALISSSIGQWVFFDSKVVDLDAVAFFDDFCV